MMKSVTAHVWARPSPETLEAGLKVIRRLQCKLFEHRPIYATFGMQSLSALYCERCKDQLR